MAAWVVVVLVPARLPAAGTRLLVCAALAVVVVVLARWPVPPFQTAVQSAASPEITGLSAAPA